MRPGQAATLGMLLSLTLALAACGEEPTAGSGRVTLAPGGAEPVAHPSAGAGCRAQLRPFLGSMDALREDLAVGLSYEGYLDELEGVRDAYDRIRAGRLPVGCLLAAAGPGEQALNRYMDAANVWGNCLATAACETESVEPELQRRWAFASDLLSSAQSGL
jgi:hypothetical protein